MVPSPAAAHGDEDIVATARGPESAHPQESRAFPYRMIAAVSTAALVALVGVLVALNIDGLRDWIFRKPVPKIESLAVLPLENLSHDAE
jgi:hypothetical protein